MRRRLRRHKCEPQSWKWSSLWLKSSHGCSSCWCRHTPGPTSSFENCQARSDLQLVRSLLQRTAKDPSTLLGSGSRGWRPKPKKCSGKEGEGRKFRRRCRGLSLLPRARLRYLRELLHSMPLCALRKRNEIRGREKAWALKFLRFCAPSGGRTHTWRILSPLPLPLGYRGAH